MRSISASTLRALGCMACAILGLFSCDDDCIDLAKKYAAELPAALMCDPSAEQCGDQLPTVDYEVSGMDMMVTGLGVCQHSFNPANDSKLKQTLSEYTSAGCELK